MMVMKMMMNMSASLVNLEILTPDRVRKNRAPLKLSKVQGPLHIAGHSNRSQAHCSKDPIWRTNSGHAVVQVRGEEPC